MANMVDEAALGTAMKLIKNYVDTVAILVSTGDYDSTKLAEAVLACEEAAEKANAAAAAYQAMVDSYNLVLAEKDSTSATSDSEEQTGD